MKILLITALSSIIGFASEYNTYELLRVASTGTCSSVVEVKSSVIEDINSRNCRLVETVNTFTSIGESSTLSTNLIGSDDSSLFNSNCRVGPYGEVTTVELYSKKKKKIKDLIGKHLIIFVSKNMKNGTFFSVYQNSDLVIESDLKGYTKSICRYEEVINP